MLLLFCLYGVCANICCFVFTYALLFSAVLFCLFVTNVLRKSQVDFSEVRRVSICIPQSVKTEWWGADIEWHANDLHSHMLQLIPLLPIISCFINVQIGFLFRCRLIQVVLQKRQLNGCVVSLIKIVGTDYAALSTDSWLNSEVLTLAILVHSQIV